MAKLTVQILGSTNEPGNGIDAVIQRVKTNLQSIQQIQVKINVDSSGIDAIDKTVLKYKQAEAKIVAANAKITASENAVKIAREKTKQVTAQATLEEKKAATAKQQAATATKKAKQAEAERALTIERGNTALKQKELQEEKTKTATEQHATASEKAKAAADNRAAAEAKATTATQRLGTETEKTAIKAESLWANFQKFARWYLIGNAFSAIARSMREALNTMKAVDDELVTIRKVTGFSDSQIAGIREQAYSTASAYGVGAADYLESVAAFSRAGYKEQSAALAELSMKTQIVGDTTAETANQFLLSVDAAYKYKGSIEDLTRVLDGANEIDNKYATSIEKIAEGMGIVAPVAAQMHVTVDELAAAIGTITAVTQRSGSEAARALRALFLNIVGDTKTEIDEGVTWTTGEIAGLRDVIKEYAPEAYKAAEATGSIIDPMEAIGGLAKSMQDGLLTEQKLMDMVSDIGGKLRTSQLLAIIQNWDMYQSMLQDYAAAVGSADKEVENALDSWSRKTEQLKNSWAQFISHLIETKTVKTAIDGLTFAIQALDTQAGKAVVTIGAIGIALYAIYSNPVLAGIGLLVYALVQIGKAAQDVNVKLQKQADQISTLQEKYESLTGAESEYAELLRKAFGDDNAGGKDIGEGLIRASEKLTEAEKDRLVVLEAEAKAAREELAARKEQLYLDWQKAHTRQENKAVLGGYLITYADTTPEVAEDAKNALAALNSEYEKTGNVVAYKEALQDLYNTLKLDAEALQAGADAGYTLSESGQAILDVFIEVNEKLKGLIGVGEDDSSLDGLADKTDKAAESQKKLALSAEEATKAFSDYSKKIDDVQTALKALSDAQEEFDENGNLSIDTIQTLLSLDKEYLDALIDENGQINLNSEAVSTLIEGKRALLDKLAAEAIATYAVKEADRLLAEQTEEAGNAAGSASSMLENAASVALDSGEKALRASNGWAILSLRLRQLAGEKGLDYVNTDTLLNNVFGYAADVQALISGVSAGGAGWSPSGNKDKTKTGGGSSSDARLDALKSAVSLRKQELSYLEASGASVDEQVDAMRAIQDALHEQAEYMRSIGADEEDVLKISTEWWTYQNKITKALEDAQKALKETALELLEAQREAALGPMKAQLELLKSQRDAAKDAREEEEKRLAVEKARIALENAQNERNVRQYNAKSGQWEWVANAQNVEKAREALESAQKSLDDYYRDQQIASLEASIKTAEASYDSLKTAIEKNDVLGRMKANSAAWWEADEAGRSRLAEENMILGMSQGWTRKNGTWYDANGRQIYDSGGILHGVGGIKATRADEMVLPPRMTAALLDAEQTGAFDALLRHLGIVTAVGRSFTGFGGGVTNSSIGSQHNGDVYQIGGVTMTEQQARCMTVYDLAQMSRRLSLHGA